MRMTRYVELVSAAVFSGEHHEIEPVQRLADLDLNPDLKKHVGRFEEIASHISTLPGDIQCGLAEIARMSFDYLDKIDDTPMVRVPKKPNIIQRREKPSVIQSQQKPSVSADDLEWPTDELPEGDQA